MTLRHKKGTNNSNYSLEMKVKAGFPKRKPSLKVKEPANM